MAIRYVYSDNFVLVHHTLESLTLTAKICITSIGEVLEIDYKHPWYSPSQGNENEAKKKPKNNYKHVTITKLNKRFPIFYTAYLIFRRTQWDPVKQQFVPETQILFCSNPFTPGKSEIIIIYMLFFMRCSSSFSQFFSQKGAEQQPMQFKV